MEYMKRSYNFHVEAGKTNKYYELHDQAIFLQKHITKQLHDKVISISNTYQSVNTFRRPCDNAVL